MNASPALFRLSFARTHAIFVLAALLTVPSLVQYVFPVDSMAPGLVLACVAILALATRRQRGDKGSHADALFPFVIIGLLALHLAVAALLQPVDELRFAGSLAILVLALGVASKVGALLFSPSSVAGRPERALVCAFIVAGVFGAAGIAPEGAAYFFKPIFPFTEPSLFALAFLPLIASVCITSSKKTRWFVLVAAFAIAAAIQNLTLIIGLLLVVLLCAPLTWTIFLAGVAAIGVGSAGLDLSYYVDRLDFSGDSQNVSALVYLQGWQFVAEAWRVSHGWGLGFQQLGIQELPSEASEIIYALLGGNPNLRDGGFLFAKLVCEMGVFGVVLLAAHFALAVRCIRLLRQVAARRLVLPSGTVFAMAIVVMYLIEVYVRSAGYFSGTGVLFLSALTFLRAHTPEGLWAVPRRPGGKLAKRDRGRQGARQATREVVDVRLGPPLGRTG